MKSMTANMATVRTLSKPMLREKTPNVFQPQRPTIISDEAITEALKRVVSNDGVITPKEVAILFGKTDSAVYKYINGTVKMSPAQFSTLVRETIRRGDFTLIDFQIPLQFSLMPDDNAELNGSVDDEIGGLTEKVGGAREKLNSGKYASALLEVHNGKKFLARMEREIRARRLS